MAFDSTPIDSDTLRQHLMAPDPMKRVVALHALEIELEPGAPAARAALAGAAAKFAARGIPFYAVNDPHYCAWVSKAVSFWQRLNDSTAFAPAGLVGQPGPSAHA